MESYRPLYRIKIAHDYFNNKPCPALQCRPTPQGADLARRRSLLFRQTGEDEWTLLFHNTPAKGDKLFLELCFADPAFILYTAWEDFHPSEVYELNLPVSKVPIDAASAIRQTGKKRFVARGFCSIILTLTDELINAAKQNEPMQATIHFRAPAVRWEYLFIPRGEKNIAMSRLRLEDTTDGVNFTVFGESLTYGQQAWRTLSETCIPMRSSYGCKLRLTAQNGKTQKRILLSQVPPPEPGKYADVPSGFLRQVCYY